MPDDQMPTGWEMKRALEALDRGMRDGLAQINARLDKVVSQDAFQAEQRRVEDRLKALERDIAEEKADRVAGDAGQQTLIDKAASGQRWLWATVIIPIAGIVLTYLLSRGGS